MPTEPNSPHMAASWHKDYVVARAISADDARELAKAHLSVAVLKATGRDTLFSPWTQERVVTCTEFEGLDFTQEGEPGILYPK